MKSNNYNAPFQMPYLSPLDFPDLKIVLKEEQEFQGNNKKAIQQAINRCAAAGGGTVIISEGNWETGPIHLKSNIHLQLEKGAVVNFSSTFSDYLPVVFTRWEGMECYNYSPLIYAHNCENIAITGEGILNGNGEAWWSWKKLQQEAANELCYAQSEGIAVEDRIYGTEESALRPSFIQPINCKDVWFQGITVQDGPQWMVHPVYCENVLIQNIRVESKGPNTDGLNPDSCKNVVIEDCFFDTGDDCIAINSGMNEDGWRVNHPCENIVIKDCQMEGGHGGIVIGSGMSGGVKNVFATNCQIKNTDQGIRLKSMRGRGGYVKDIRVENITVNGIIKEAIQINMFYGYTTVEPKTQKPPIFENISIKNVQGVGAAIGIELKGLPEKKLASINIENIHLEAEQGIVCHDIQKLELTEIFLKEEERQISEFKNILKSRFVAFNLDKK
ncbi:MAG: glycoside hydrolase family 28 protein [Enterococcus casseliflavus]|jgi:Endopolygalacturonase|nr:glycoside hydrolase family 28 protein [Enterococcus casseliflavus]